MEAMLTLARTLGCAPDNNGPALWIPDSSRRTAARCLESVGIDASSPYVVFHVGSNKPEARLPEDRAIGIGKAISSATHAPVLVAGAHNEASSAERLARRIGGEAQSLAGRADLVELAAILEGARAAVTTDSGPMHLAAAMGTPLVALFGPGDPRRFGPRGHEGRIVVLQGRGDPHDAVRWHIDIRADDVADALLNRLRLSGAHAQN
jgi:ADP-heptose:LPS heptosyltransferase